MSYRVNVVHPSNVILLDVDGVCADIMRAFRLEAFRLGLGFSSERRYDVLEQYTEADQAKLRAVIEAPGFASSLLPVYGAVDGVNRLRVLGFHVLFVTSPLKNDHWPIERIHWLEKNFGAKYSDVLNTKHKNLVRGSILIDDHPDHVVSWSRTNGGAPAIWFDSGWSNQPTEPAIIQACDWDDVIDIVATVTTF